MEIKILLIEDDSDDIELMQDALALHKVQYEMEVITDGSEALRYIHTCEECPDVVILDFNLPKIHGREMLSEIRNVAAFKDVPLVILTTSSLPEDIAYSYKNGASKYLVKPTTLQQIKEMVDIIVALAKEHRDKVKAL